jgi:cellulose synthase/poly-beta-1,6-N-acetylglucosamine synthase-like glycosyltransferase
MILAFWASLAVIGYVYAGYPALVWLWARLRPAPAAPDRTADTPAISIVVAARNEARHLPARLDNLLRLDYPPSRRQIIVVDDGSTDDTLTILDRYRDAVDVVAVTAAGKALALNAGVRRARHPVLVFTDARQVFADDALLELTAPLCDPRVGVVTGELVLDGEAPGRRMAADDRRASAAAIHPSVQAAGAVAVAVNRRTISDRRRTIESTIADGVGLYWRYEKQIRRSESAAGSMLGATGAIYAMRRSLWKPLPADTILDDVLIPMRAVMAGYRVVFNDRARAFDRAAANAEAETRRKIRTLAGNYQILWLDPRLLLPWSNPVWIQYVSHKIGRLLVPYALLVLMAASMALAGRSIVYAAALFGQCAFYLLAGYGAWLDLQGIAARATPPAAAANTAVGWTARRPADHTGAVNA